MDGEARGEREYQGLPAVGDAPVREVAVGAAYRAGTAPGAGGSMREVGAELRRVMRELDEQRREIRRLRAETREILAALAA